MPTDSDRKRSRAIERRTADLDGVSLSYMIRRHPRAKHMRVQVNPFDGTVVTMPRRLRFYPNPDEFVRKNGEWILNKLSDNGIDPSEGSATNRRLISGQLIPFRGEEHQILILVLPITRPHVLYSDIEKSISLYIPRTNEKSVEEIFRAWARKRSKEVVEDSLERAAALIGTAPSKLTVREQRTKWGSCSADGKISINWRLLFFPPQVLDYVVVHEVCHLLEFNHSIKFWRLVAKNFPNYRWAVDWLATEGTKARNLMVQV